MYPQPYSTDKLCTSAVFGRRSQIKIKGLCLSIRYP